MKRRLSRPGNSDSSEMILDTLTNVFGSIILIACILAILPREVSRVTPAKIADARGEIIERRTKAAEAELRQVQKDIAELAESVDPGLAKLLERRDYLRSTLEDLRARVGDAETGTMSDAKLRALANHADPVLMASHLDLLKTRLTDEQVKNDAISDKRIFLKDRLKDLQEEAAALKEGRIQTVRFPREKGARRSSFPIILVKGSIYPLGIGADLSENPGIVRRDLDVEDGSFEAEPIVGRGLELPADRALLRETIEAAKKQNAAVSVYLYPDSHEVFQDLKAEIFAVGAGYGVEFVKKGKTLAFGENGTQPSEL
jgi:hypothetical protein